MNIISIRGATTVFENSKTCILEGTRELIIEIEKANQINRDDVISILFSCTKDLTEAYPAKAVRDLGYLNTSLMCFNEMYVKESLEKCIRVMILCKSKMDQQDVKHIYLRNAKVLRPDLSNKA